MLQTLRIYRKLRNLGIYEFPWRNPIIVLKDLKYDYQLFGLKGTILERIAKLRGLAEFYLFERYTRKFRKQLREVYLESRIFALNSLIRHYERKAEETNEQEKVE